MEIVGQQLEIQPWDLGRNWEKDTDLEGGFAEMMPESVGVG